MALSAQIRRIFPWLLLGAYTLFMCGYFFLEHYSEHYRLFARFVFVLGLFVFVAGIRPGLTHPVFIAILAYMGYLLLSGLWSTPLDWYRLGQHATIAVYLLCFIAITRYLLHWRPVWFERALQLCVLVAAAAALTSIFVFYRDHAFPATRLEGLGSLTNINEFAVVYGVYALLALGFALRSTANGWRALYLLSIGIFLAFAWLGQSRTTLLALVLALFALVSLAAHKRQTCAIGTLGLLAGLGALVLAFPDSIAGALYRGVGLRPEIWADVWREIAEAPLLGHGLTTPLQVQTSGGTFGNAHSAYLQVLWQGGVVGLGLFLLLLYLAGRHAWRYGRTHRDYTLLAMLLFAATVMFTDLDTLIARPREQWLLFWFPLALLLAGDDLPRWNVTATPAAA